MEEPEARALFERGQSVYHEGDYETALEAWTRAYELSGRAAILYNIAQAHGRLGRFLDEKRALERFLEEYAASRNIAWAPCAASSRSTRASHARRS